MSVSVQETGYGFSKQLGGDLEIVSTPGAGSRIRIIVPCAGATAAAEREASRVSKGVTGVEDEDTLDHAAGS